MGKSVHEIHSGSDSGSKSKSEKGRISAFIRCSKIIRGQILGQTIYETL